AVSLRHRIRTEGPAPGPGRSLGRPHRQRRGPGGAVLLPVRSGHRPLRGRHHEDRAAGQRRDGPGVGRLHRHDAPAGGAGGGPGEALLMSFELPLFPQQASTFASRVDLLYGFLVAISIFFTALIASFLVVFAVRYRRRPGAPAPGRVQEPLVLELTWTLIPLGIVTIIFVWSTQLFVAINRP